MEKVFVAVSYDQIGVFFQSMGFYVVVFVVIIVHVVVTTFSTGFWHWHLLIFFCLLFTSHTGRF